MEGANAGPATALIAAILERFPSLLGMRDIAVMLGHIHWWAPQLVEHELPRWKSSERETVPSKAMVNSLR